MKRTGELRDSVYLNSDNRARHALALQNNPPENTLRAIARARLFQVFVFLAALSVAAFSVYHRFQAQTATPCASDFYAYYRSALRLGQGVAPYTGLANWIRVHSAASAALGPFTDASCAAGTLLEYSYTPFLGFLLLPFTWLPFQSAVFVWDVCNLLFLALAIYAFLRAAHVAPSLPWLLALTATAMLASPLRFDLYYAQLDVFFLCVACLALWARVAGHAVLAGVLLALACASEPALLIVVAFLLWKREVKFATVTVIGSVALILAPFLWLGGQSLRDMLVVWRFYGSQYAVTFTNDAPRGVLLRLFTSSLSRSSLTTVPTVATALWLLLALVTVSLTLPRLTARPLDREVRTFLEIGLAVATILLISPWSENGQFTWLLLPVLAVYISIRHTGLATPAGRKLLIGFAIALLFLFLIGDDAQISLLAHAAMSPRIAPLLGVLAATYLYSLFAISGVALYAQHLLALDKGGTSGRAQHICRWTHGAKVHIIGGPGSGKTSLSRTLATLWHVPVVELDEIAGAGLAPLFRMERPLARRLADVERIAASPGWITEGSYLWWTDGLLRSADLIIWLDIPSHVALRRVITRHIQEYLRGITEQRDPRGLLAAIRHPHLPHLFAFVRYTWSYQHRPSAGSRPAEERLDDGWALSRAATEGVLAAYVNKVVRCTHPIDITCLLESVMAARSAQGVEVSL